MKKLIVLILTALVFNCSINGQEYFSNKQSYLIGYGTEFIDIEQDKKVTINGGNLVAELPNGETFKSDIIFRKIQKNGIKEGKLYDAGENILVIYQDEIFLNINGEIATTYFLKNYELNSDQEKAEKAQGEKYTYELNIKLYGKLTADCIRDKKIEVGMNYMGIFDILGEPKSRNTTETANGLKQQFVYSNMNIYTEGEYVKAIQTRSN